MSNSLGATKTPLLEGLLLIDKPRGPTAFDLVAILRRVTRVQKIGHAGTLDPFATGVMVMLIGQKYTRLSNTFLEQDKEYTARLLLGSATDTFDCDGKIIRTSPLIPTLSTIEAALSSFQGNVLQTPPMFSAKKQAGKKLYELARKGITVERAPVPIHLTTTLLAYDYPHLDLHVRCSKGTYLRVIAEDLGNALGCYAHLITLTRTRSGPFRLEETYSLPQIISPTFPWDTACQK